MELGPFLAPVEKLTWNDDLGFWCLSLSLCFWGFVLLGGRVCIGCARLGFLGFRGRERVCRGVPVDCQSG